MKSIMKSIRMTEELFGYVDGYRGNGFSEKLNNLVIDSLLGESSRNERLEALDKEILRKHKELQSLASKCEVLARLRRDIVYLEKQVTSLALPFQDKSE